MREIAIQSAIGFVILILLILTKATIRYHVTRRFLLISWLGLPVRWVRLKNIRQIATYRVFWAERWINVFGPTNRYLLVRKYSGIFKNLAITPKSHMVFKADVERARQKLLAPSSQDGQGSNGGSADTPTDVLGTAAE